MRTHSHTHTYTTLNDVLPSTVDSASKYTALLGCFLAHACRPYFKWSNVTHDVLFSWPKKGKHHDLIMNQRARIDCMRRHINQALRLYANNTLESLPHQSQQVHPLYFVLLAVCASPLLSLIFICLVAVSLLQ